MVVVGGVDERGKGARGRRKGEGCVYVERKGYTMSTEQEATGADKCIVQNSKNCRCVMCVRVGCVRFVLRGR